MVKHLKGCCGLPLKEGSIIIGVLYAVIFPAIIILNTVFPQASKDDENENPGNKHMSPDSDHDDVDFYAVAGCALEIFLGIILIIGASAEKPALLKTWIVAKIIWVIVNGITVILEVILSFFAVGLIGSGFLILFIWLVILRIEIYFILVVNSLHTELTTEQPPNVTELITQQPFNVTEFTTHPPPYDNELATQQLSIVV